MCNLVTKKHGLTLRQSQAIVSIYQRTLSIGNAKITDLLADMGVAHATLADHLAALQRKWYIQTPKDKNGNQRPPRNLSSQDKITITEKGKRAAKTVMKYVDVSYKDYAAGAFFTRLKKSYEPKWYQQNLFGTKNSSFAKAFEELIDKNPSEPVLTTIVMYTDLDSQLSLMRLSNKEEYVTLSRAKLNLEIRNGRLASIAIPAAIRNRTKLTSLKQLLRNSWSWTGAVSSTSKRRYWDEATSLGLIQIVGNSVQSLKPNTTDTINWLAKKTHFTFINTIPTAPKCALVLFREAFRLPSEEDLLDPRNADNLEWLQFIWENMGDKSDYVEAVAEALTILKDRTNLLQEYEGSIVPTTLIRKISSEKELATNFRTMLKERNTITSNILTAISAKPSVSLAQLRADLNKKATKKFSKEDIEETISFLASRNLVYLATSRSALKASTKLFSFIHVPYILSKKTNDTKEANAVLRGMNPYLLQQIKDLFSNEEERTAVINTLQRLMDIREINFEDIGREYGKTFERKMLRFTLDLDPFACIKDDYSGFVLNPQNAGLNNIIINSLIYSAIARNDALDVYTTAIENLVERDAQWHNDIAEESKILVNDLIEKNRKDLSWYM